MVAVTRPPRVLFLCTANSCRSQMAEGWLRRLAGPRVQALSAGTHPTELHPLAVRVMAEVGVDISAHQSDPLQAHLEDPPELVIAVCNAVSVSCPALPGCTPMLSWPFPDPAAVSGSEAQRLVAFRHTRDEIRKRIDAWIRAGFPGLPHPPPRP